MHLGHLGVGGARVLRRRVAPVHLDPVHAPLSVAAARSSTLAQSERRPLRLKTQRSVSRLAGSNIATPCREKPRACTRGKRSSPSPSGAVRGGGARRSRARRTPRRPSPSCSPAHRARDRACVSARWRALCAHSGARALSSQPQRAWRKKEQRATPRAVSTWCVCVLARVCAHVGRMRGARHGWPPHRADAAADAGLGAAAGVEAKRQACGHARG